MKPHAVAKSIFAIALTALILAPFANSSFAKSRVTPQISARPAQITLSFLPLLADFDGDLRVDLAEVHSVGAHQCIRVRFGNSRESHLDSGAALPSRGSLLARDINLDHKSDLIWVPPSRSELPVIWLGDGLGNFEKAVDNGAYQTALSSLVFGDANSEMAGGSRAEEQGYLPSDPGAYELARAASVETEIPTPLTTVGCNGRRDLGLYLSYLRERGPPLHISLV